MAKINQDLRATLRTVQHQHRSARKALAVNDCQAAFDHLTTAAQYAGGARAQLARFSGRTGSLTKTERQEISAIREGTNPRGRIYDTFRDRCLVKGR